MNIQNLIEAAKEIKKQNDLQKEYSDKLSSYANLARKNLMTKQDKIEYENFKKQPTVFNYEDPIKKLIKALGKST